MGVQTGSGNLVGRRRLGYRPENVTFDVHRVGTKADSSPVTASTSYFHADAPATADHPCARS